MPRSPSSSVEQAKRALGQRLRELRLDAGLTQVALARACAWERTKVSKVESGTQNPSVDDVRAWCGACEAQAEAENLIATLRAVESAYVEWRRLERTGLRQLQESAVPLHERTRHFRVYQSLVVPGQLQTPGYATALLTSIRRFRQLPDDVSDAVEARVQRQRMLRTGNRRFALLIEESVLRYRVGDQDVMAEQLDHLAAVMSLPSVSLGIIPFTAERPMWAVEGFTVFDAVEVSVELLSAIVTVTQPVEIAAYIKAFFELAELAVHGDAARALITAARAALGT
ncbi:helix-turn-helix domain-containing protein [Actinomadura fibrosa]|uniref:Helix-turn-helix domain-containing protein n=1 Tax=Actinomadura fibrosa TaxID=111802 RepID=A0ABW2XMA2_9ACTN|nr:helix-turn-helix transcriptional regulator [Actinomadura fibrosa]